MISNSELTVSDEPKDDIEFTGNFIQNPKNIDIIKKTINSSNDIKDNILYYSDKIECIPSIIHFSGFNVNSTQKQFL
eukprot:jgi/Orpsp1_1/1191286/evm.model.d7180000084696.1